MLIAQCNGCRIMKPSLFTVVPFKPHYHSTILSVIGRQDKVYSYFVLCCCYFGSQKNRYDPVAFATTTWKCDGLLSIATLSRGTFNTIVFNDLWLGLAV